MGPRDILLIFFSICIVGFFTYQRMARSLFSLVVLWGATIMSALLYEEIVYRMSALLGKNPRAAEGAIFIVLLLVFFMFGYALVHVSFPETKLPKIGVLDYVMGALLGTLITVIILSLVQNSIGVMVSEPWPKYEVWFKLQASFTKSPLRILSREVISAYRVFFRPFFRIMPAALSPQ